VNNPQNDIHKILCTAPMSKVEAHLKKYFESKWILGANEHFELSEAEIKSIPALVAEFEQHFKHMREADALKKALPSEELIEPDPKAIDTYRQYRALDEQIYRLGQERDALEFVLQIMIGSTARMTGIATWKECSFSSFDREAFDRDYTHISPQAKEQAVSRISALLNHNASRSSERTL
jgi:hypothetical protein